MHVSIIKHKHSLGGAHIMPMCTLGGAHMPMCTKYCVAVPYSRKEQIDSLYFPEGR